MTYVERVDALARRLIRGCFPAEQHFTRSEVVAYVQGNWISGDRAMYAACCELQSAYLIASDLDAGLSGPGFATPERFMQEFLPAWGRMVQEVDRGQYGVERPSAAQARS